MNNFGVQSFLQGHNFTKPYARPPAIGEENEVTSVDGRMSTHSSVSGKSELSTATPRRTDIDLGFEPEGSASPLPTCDRWRSSLHNMLEDSEGIRLFKIFLADSKRQELLNCWLACKGFRDFGTKNNYSNNSSAASSTTGPLTAQRTQFDAVTRGKLAKTIFNTYLKKDKCHAVSSIIRDATRQYICKQIKNALQAQKNMSCSVELDASLFDQAQNEIESNIEENSYISFLKSELFQNYAAQCENKPSKQSPQNASTLHHSENKSAPSNAPQAAPTELTVPEGRYGYLPRLDENREWSLPPVQPKNNPAYPYIAAPGATKYYVPPASANASDNASSDATSDSLSMTDGSVDLDGSSAYSSKKNKKRMMRFQLRKNPMIHYPPEFVPLNRRCHYKQNQATLATEKPKEFFAQLKEKLEKVEEEQRRREVLEAANADNVEDILDSHIERVMKTPIAVNSPHRNESPPPAVAAQMRQRSANYQTINFPQDVPLDSKIHQRGYPKDEFEVLSQSDRVPAIEHPGMLQKKNDTLKRRKEVAVGMAPNEVPDVLEVPAQPVDKNFMISLWVKDSSNANQIPPQEPNSVPRRGSVSRQNHAHHRYINRGSSFPIHSLQSVVTNRANQFQMQPLQPISQDQMMPPLEQPDANTTIEEVKRRLIQETEQGEPMHGLSLGNKSGLHQVNQYPSSFSGSVMGPSLLGSARKQRDTETRYPNQGMPHYNYAQSSSSSGAAHCIPPKLLQQSLKAGKQYVFSMPHEEMAYKIQIPHSPVTLEQFKTYVGRKGNYKYFFKQYSEEMSGPVYFEVSKDNDVLPLWEKAVVAKVQEYDL
uniref:LOW QUALITY PROTEIN: axin-1-like n=1 Tax=Styela clava TaxID=7725 RepID=UPI0019399445|nr:LOW QUALITY PROTEIN: axin-1-like [Styela clava]